MRIKVFVRHILSRYNSKAWRWDNEATDAHGPPSLLLFLWQTTIRFKEESLQSWRVSDGGGSRGCVTTWPGTQATKSLARGIYMIFLAKLPFGHQI